MFEGEAHAATGPVTPMRAGNVQATSGPSSVLVTAYVFDSLELRRAVPSGGDYTRSTVTEVPYLVAHGVRLARVHEPSAAAAALPSPAGVTPSVLLELPDHLGSSSIVIDQASGEVVERGTYLAYGQADSDYRPARWASYRDDYRFTGKEEDVQVGLTYFGKRYLSPYLGRWVSADPLAVHGQGADLNPYAYVHGALLAAVDLRGLDLTPFQQMLDSVANPTNPVGKGVTDALAERGEGLVRGVVASGHAVAQGDLRPIGAMATGIVSGPVKAAIAAGRHSIAMGEAIAAGDKAGVARHATHMVLSVADAVTGAAGAAGILKAGASTIGTIAREGVSIPVPGIGAGGLGTITVKVGGRAERATVEAAEGAPTVVEHGSEAAARRAALREAGIPAGTSPARNVPSRPGSQAATGPRGTRGEWDPISDAKVGVHHDPNGHSFPDGSTIDPHYGVDVPNAPTVHHTYPSAVDPRLNR